MRQTVTISLPEKMKKALDKVTRSEGLTRSDIIRESLQDYLFLKQFRSLRARMMEKAREQGVYSDKDVFDRVSLT